VLLLADDVPALVPADEGNDSDALFEESDREELEVTSPFRLPKVIEIITTNTNAKIPSKIVCL
jgi:hypothetical protein